MKNGIVNEKNKDKMIALLNALSDVLADDNMCDNKCDEHCPYSYLMLGDFSACTLSTTYRNLLIELLQELNKDRRNPKCK